MLDLAEPVVDIALGIAHVEQGGGYGVIDVVLAGTADREDWADLGVLSGGDWVTARD